LWNYLSKAAGGKLDKFIESEIMFLTKLEDAYIGARYLPRKYERGEGREAPPLLRKVQGGDRECLTCI